MYDVDEFLTKILEGKGTLEKNIKALLKVLSKSCAEVIKKMDFQALSQDLADAISEHLQSSNPPQSVKGIHFGLRENVDGCALYMAGTHLRETPEFRDSEDWDWTGSHRGCLKLSSLSLLWNSIAITDEEEWEVILGISVILLKAYLDQNHKEFTDMLGIKDIYVTAGFDDGEIYKLA